MAERGIDVSHTSIMRWVHQYAPELDKKRRRKLKLTGDSWKLDETYVKIKGKWKYLYRAVDKQGNTLDFYLSSYRDQLAAARFLKKLILAMIRKGQIRNTKSYLDQVRVIEKLFKLAA